MVEIKANISVQIPGGLQINALQSLKLESYQYFDLNLDKTHPTGVIKLNDLLKSSLILIKSTLVLGKASTAKLKYKIGTAGTDLTLDAPLLLLGSWITLAKDAGEITFKLDPTPTETLNPDDTAKIEIITGWLDVDGG